MAVDKLVDSTQLDSDLTSVANAIRAKSGGSSSLAFPAGFVSEIQAIPGGGGMTLGWASSVTEVTIGANSVTKTAGVNNYFSGYTYAFLFLKDSVTRSRQCIGGYCGTTRGTMTSCWRDQDGFFKACSVDNSYDCYLVEGSTYYLVNI